MRLCLYAAVLTLASAWAPAATADEAYKLRVDGWVCAYCAYGVEKKLRAVEGVKDIEVHVYEGYAVVTTEDDAGFDEASARRAVRDAGFTLRGFERVSAAD